MTRVSNNKIRVLVYGLTNYIGGIETFYLSYLRRMDLNRFQIDFITIFDEIVFEKELRNLGCKIYKIPNFRSNYFGYKNALKNIVKNGNYDIFHVNICTRANILMLKIAKQCGVKHIIVHSHSSNVKLNLLKKFLHYVNKNAIIKFSTERFACSNKAGEWLFEEKDFTIIKNRIDYNVFYYDKEKAKTIRQRLELGNSFVVGHIGKFCYEKNHIFILNVLNSLRNISKDIDVKCVLIGAGELYIPIIEMAKKMGLNDKIVFTGVVNNPQDYYNAFDIFILPSLFEGFPLVGIEAQVNGLKCLFSDNITRELMLKDGECEYLSLDEKLWVDKIYDEYKNRTKRKVTLSGEYNINEYNQLEEEYKKINGE